MLNGAWLVRHGATDSPAGVAIGWSDPPLSGEGRRQAQALANQLSTRPVTAVYSSDRVRAISTAEAVAAVHGVAVQIDARLRELDFGAWEGRSLGDLWAAEPAAAAAWENDLRETPRSFGENVARLEARVAAFFASVRAPRRGEVVVVAHRGSLAVLRSLITGAPLEAALAARMLVGTADWAAASSRSLG